MVSKRRPQILIVDDTDVNRDILSDILEQDYNVLEASSGLEAIEVLRRHEGALSLILLDIVMPGMDGFEMLAYLRKNHWAEDVPIIVISSETSPGYVKKGFELGVTDYVSRPFDPEIVSRRVANVIGLFSKQERLKDLVVHSMQEQEKRDTLMVDILSSIVEFRNGESGLHVMRIRIISEILLEAVSRRFPQYGLSPSRIALISTAAALHDIGKITLPGSILNKPGKLTDEEFKVMKTHTIIGDEMLRGLQRGADIDLVKCARSICRWHHERWDGNGYPDGLSGDAIPIEAQVVALADVYDALVSERVYKPAYTHDEAVDIILSGGCGAFNPALLACFEHESLRLEEMLCLRSDESYERSNVGIRVQESLEGLGPGIAGRTALLLNGEREKLAYLASSSPGLVFDFDADSDTVELYGALRKTLGLPHTIANTVETVSRHVEALPALQQLNRIHAEAGAVEPDVSCDMSLPLPGGGELPCHLESHLIWVDSTLGPRCMGIIGSVIPKKALA
ncbi:response regulator [Eggerthellaceae bacterium zg-887]|nr:response regulator [Xiamenia xianingshaonis]